MDILVPLTENHEYKRVYARGKSAVRPVLVLYCLRNKKVKQARVGITASKKIGNAVKRNRARRLLRESIRALYPQLKPGYSSEKSQSSASSAKTGTTAVQSTRSAKKTAKNFFFIRHAPFLPFWHGALHVPGGH